MRCYLSSRWRIQKTEETGLKQLEAAVTSLDQGGDRDALLQQHDSAFCLPFRFNYHPHEGDQVQSTSSTKTRPVALFLSRGFPQEVWHSLIFVCAFQVCEVSAESQVRYELETRFQQLQSRLAAVTLETEEVR